MKLVPLGDRVVLKELKAEETTKSGGWVDKAANPSKCWAALFLILRYSVFQN